MLPFGMLCTPRGRAVSRAPCFGFLPEADPTSSLIGKFIEAPAPTPA
jgi:hypothetical protein